MLPAAETCDGLDNDCDGNVDEDGVCGTCGNGNIDTGEQCDGTNLNGATCLSLGFSGGSLMCDASCAYDTGSCTGACADLDSDTYTDVVCGGLDCNDSDPSIHPGATEVCDGVDDDCDGQVDEGNPGGGGSCATGLQGVCSAGTTTCSAGSLTCQPNQSPSAEVCDGLDNNRDGQVDEGGVCN